MPVSDQNQLSLHWQREAGVCVGRLRRAEGAKGKRKAVGGWAHGQTEPGIGVKVKLDPNAYF